MDQTRSLTVFVVDDHADVRFLVRTMLTEDRDIEVVGEASTAEEALRLLPDLAPDVVLLDARMPLTDGFETAPKMLALRPRQTIVLLTTVVDDGIRERAAAAGIQACLSKEDFSDLAAAVKVLAGTAPALAA